MFRIKKSKYSAIFITALVFIILTFPATVYSGGLKFGIISVVKDKIDELKQKKKEKGYSNGAEGTNNGFTMDKNYFYLNGEKFIVKGMNYYPSYPGEWPWDYNLVIPLPVSVENRTIQDFKDMKSIGVNTIRIWDCSYKIYEEAKKNVIYILNTIWVRDTGDYQAPAFKNEIMNYIKNFIDGVHNKNGVDYSDIILAYTVGNEFSKDAINYTDSHYTYIDQYIGEYITAPLGSTATECFIAEMADYIKKYEHDTYGVTHFVTYVNHPGTDTILKCGFLDFLDYNGYSNSVPDFHPGLTGSHTNSNYQGWLEMLRSWFPNKPLLISEFGLNTAPGLPWVGPPNYGYGGNTEADQSDGIEAMWNDILTANPPLAGGIIFEYYDQWCLMYNSPDDKDYHDKNDGEEWFGIIGFDYPNSINIDYTNYIVRKKPAFYKVQELFTKP